MSGRTPVSITRDHDGRRSGRRRIPGLLGIDRRRRVLAAVLAAPGGFMYHCPTAGPPKVGVPVGGVNAGPAA